MQIPKSKLNTIEKDMKNLQEENKENKEYKNCQMEITRLTKEKIALETELNKSQTVISNYFSDCLT
mgnify:CR=1 FL=1